MNERDDVSRVYDAKLSWKQKKSPLRAVIFCFVNVARGYRTTAVRQLRRSSFFFFFFNSWVIIIILIGEQFLHRKRHTKAYFIFDGEQTAGRIGNAKQSEEMKKEEKNHIDDEWKLFIFHRRPGAENGAAGLLYITTVLCGYVYIALSIDVTGVVVSRTYGYRAVVVDENATARKNNRPSAANGGLRHLEMRTPKYARENRRRIIGAGTSMDIVPMRAHTAFLPGRRV